MNNFRGKLNFSLQISEIYCNNYPLGAFIGIEFYTWIMELWIFEEYWFSYLLRGDIQSQPQSDFACLQGVDSLAGKLIVDCNI